MNKNRKKVMVKSTTSTSKNKIPKNERMAKCEWKRDVNLSINSIQESTKDDEQNVKGITTKKHSTFDKNLTASKQTSKAKISMKRIRVTFQKGLDRLNACKKEELDEDKSESWEWSDWRDFIKILAIFIVLHDFMHQHHLYWIAMKNGGWIPVCLVFILSITVHLPLMQLFSQIGHFVRGSSVHIFSRYGKLFGWIGFCMLLSTSYESSYHVFTAGYDITLWKTKNITNITSCEFNPKSIYGDFPHRHYCCISVVEAKLCKETNGTSREPAWCSKIDPWSCLAEPATFSNMKDRNFIENRELPVVTMSIFIIVGGLAAILPLLVFLGLTVVVALTGITGSLIVAFAFMHYGNTSVGIVILNRFTKWSCIYDGEMWYGVLLTVLMFSCSKFTLISLSSTVTKQKRLYWPILFLYFGHIITIFIYFWADVTMFGQLQAVSDELLMPTSAPFTRFFDINQVIVPEFLALVQPSHEATSWLNFFDVSIMFMRIARVSAPFICVIATYYHQRNSFLRRASLICFVINSQAGLMTTLIYSNGISGSLLDEALSALNCTLILFGLTVAIVVYGLNQHLNDICKAYPRTGTWLDYVGPLSPFYSFCLLNITLPSIVIFLLLSAWRIDKVGKDKVKQLESLGGTMAEHAWDVYLALVLYVIAGLVILGYLLCYVIYPIYTEEIDFWHTIFPSEEHPAYERITKRRIEQEKEEACRDAEENEVQN